MVRIRPLKHEEASPEARAAFDGNIEAYGQALQTTGVYAHCPSIMTGRQGLAQGIERSGLIPARLRNLVCVRVAMLVGCPF